MNFIRKIHDKIFPSYKDKLIKETTNCRNLLDVGCGKDSPVQYLDKNIYSVGVDVFAPAIEYSRKRKIHNEYKKMDVMGIDSAFAGESFDCVLASDLLEHVTKRDGLELIKKLENVSRHKIIIFTPRGFLPQDEYDNNPWQIHKSGWEVEEMESMGYKVGGINGLKAVWNIDWLWKNGPRANILVRIVRRLLVDLTQIFAGNNPKYAFQIMCVKSKNNG